MISCETGPSSRPAGRAFRYHYLPDRRARSFAWMMLGYGLYGTHYWTWSTNDEYGCLDWDGTLCDYGLEAALANREMQAVRPALAGLMPRVDLGFLYPRASFVQGERTVLEAYGRSYRALAEAGYQVRLVAPSDFDRAAPSLSHLFVPPAPYLESALVERLTRYVRAGGTLIVCGEPGGFDEYARPRPGGLRPLTGAASDAGHAVGKGRVYWLGWEGDAASAAVILPAALQRAGAPRSLSAAPAGISQRVLVGQKGERYLVVSNLSGAEKRWEVTVYGTAGARPAYVDLLTGERMTAKRAGGGLVVSLALEAEGARLVRLDAGR
ncbi:MAG: beta-galactosidase trimerization domain-containing protein [Armatimonadetes bacterium]|nr:beta-galactosidase trimerization domain-containing protein [Armatimonadota bacterium]